jgi:ketosteroid isomerase-like protein
VTSTLRAEAEEANQALYSAVESGDLDALELLWDETEDVVCVHPGSELLTGRGRVLRSWAGILANIDYLQFVLTDVEVRVSGDVAVVTCGENVLSGDEVGFHGGSAWTTNVFRRRSGRWRLWVHHASPTPASLGVDDDD